MTDRHHHVYHVLIDHGLFDSVSMDMLIEHIYTIGMISLFETAEELSAEADKSSLRLGLRPSHQVPRGPIRRSG